MVFCSSVDNEFFHIDFFLCFSRVENLASQDSDVIFKFSCVSYALPNCTDALVKGET